MAARGERLLGGVLSAAGGRAGTDASGAGGSERGGCEGRAGWDSLGPELAISKPPNSTRDAALRPHQLGDGD